MSAVSQDHQPTLVLRGEISEAAVSRFEMDLDAVRGSEVIVDLTEVTLFSAAAMGVVVRARNLGTTVRLVNLSSLTARSFAAVGLSTA